MKCIISLYVSEDSRVDLNGFCEAKDKNNEKFWTKLRRVSSGQNAGGVSEQVTSMSETARREYLAKMDDLNNNITTLNALFREQKLCYQHSFIKYLISTREGQNK